MDTFVCSSCGKLKVEKLRASGECFGCHIHGVGFNFVGGGGRSRKVWNDATIPERIRQEIGGRSKDEVEYTGRAVLR